MCETNAVSGTLIEEVTLYEDNPVIQREHQALFHDGYWQIVVSSNGKNPSFAAGTWSVVLVAPLDKTQKFEFEKNGFTSEFIDPGTTVEKVFTEVEVFGHEGIDWEIAVIIVETESALKSDLLRFMCWEPEPIEKPPAKRLN